MSSTNPSDHPTMISLAQFARHLGLDYSTVWKIKRQNVDSFPAGLQITPSRCVYALPELMDWFRNRSASVRRRAAHA